MMNLKSLYFCIGLAQVATPSLAEDLTFTLTNDTSLTITRFFTSPIDVDSWEEDVFGNGTLESGQSTQITIADGRSQCDYDLKVVFEDDSEFTDQGNLCETAEYVVSEQ